LRWAHKRLYFERHTVMIVVEELRTHLAWRWFTGLGFDQGGSASLDILQQAARAVSGIESD
jgi:hypothetical protein